MSHSEESTEALCVTSTEGSL